MRKAFFNVLKRQVWFLNKIWVFVTDLEFVKSVIHHKTDPFPRHPMMNALVKPVSRS